MDSVTRKEEAANVVFKWQILGFVLNHFECPIREVTLTGESMNDPKNVPDVS